MEKEAKYKTFIRMCNNFEQFSKARKKIVDRNLTLSEARRACDNFNKNRTKRQITQGTMMEFMSK